jgi:hypothetical protein
MNCIAFVYAASSHAIRLGCSHAVPLVLVASLAIYFMHTALLFSPINQVIYSFAINLLQPCCLLVCTALLLIWLTTSLLQSNSRAVWYKLLYIT